MKRISPLPFLIIVLLIIPQLLLAQGNKERIVFEERQIEGKLRRPQLVLVKADQRPDFQPMVMQSLSNLNVFEFSKGDVVEKSPYSGVFQFNGQKISNYKH